MAEQRYQAVLAAFCRAACCASDDKLLLSTLAVDRELADDRPTRNGTVH